MYLPKAPKNFRSLLTAMCADMSNFALGTCIGWSSPIIPKLRNQTYDSPLSQPVTTTEEGWISSMVTIGAVVTSLLAGPMGAKIGKKWVLLLGATLIELSYVFLLLASEVWMFYAARLLQGVAGGLLIATLPMYVGEIATNDNRGSLGSLMTLFMVGGILYAYCIGPFVSYMAFHWCCLAVPLIFIVSFPFMPETPYYLAKTGRKVELLKSLNFLRGNTDEKAVEDEMNQIQSSVDEDASRKASIFDIFHDRGNVKGLVICCGLLMFQQFSGTTAVTFNSQTIFESAKSTLDPAVATIILALTQLVSNFLTPFVIERTGRKLILLASALGMSLSLFALGAFFYVQAFGDVTPLMWIPVPALICFNISYAFGFGPVPWAILGEVFPSNVKPMAASIASTFSWTSSFLSTRWFPDLNALGPYYAFFLFGIMMAIAIFFILFYVIETRGLSLQKIQEKLHS
ncbi:facilitated trehalose transporter Tret1-like [Eupeodes corollae]|uniref:facilitated trehalose transporter Tret1-like n=1 Tax=Eupeodes corollae TaxID=290404 RepID=UPI00249019F1|nr:facilitated trehalose transporter Tret1-like [Eupeodes corollae]XP_055906833.1 facilitated trehalose transporter Tret1-like [Eupeodes corollae]